MKIIKYRQFLFITLNDSLLRLSEQCHVRIFIWQRQHGQATAQAPPSSPGGLRGAGSARPLAAAASASPAPSPAPAPLIDASST